MIRNAFIENVADKITNLGLTAPAILLLEAHKPLAFIGSQLLLIAQPSLDLFLNRNLTQNYIKLLSDSAQCEQLILQLEVRNIAHSVPSSANAHHASHKCISDLSLPSDESEKKASALPHSRLSSKEEMRGL